jgi:hypothetical protein
VLVIALVAGIAAALVTAAFHALLVEPIIDRAIAVEASLDAGHSHGAAAPIVSREWQRVGLWIGWVGVGITYATLSGAAYFLAWRPLRNAAAWQWRAAVAVAGGWAIGLFPLLRFPANPPSVGDPTTIAERTRDFLAFEGLGLIVVILALLVWESEFVGRRGGGRRVLLAGLAAAATWAAGSLGLYLLIPMAPQPGIPPQSIEIVEEFRRHVVVGQLLFWLVFGIGFSALPAWRPLSLTPDETGRASAAAARAGAR